MRRARLPGTPIIFEVEGDASGEFDVSRTREVLGKLVSNAAKYGTPGSAVVTRPTGDSVAVQLSVEDVGDPIPVAAEPQLFEPPSPGRAAQAPWRPCHPGSRPFIAREIARGHDGDIVALSANGTTRHDTTRFTMRLPRKSNSAEA